MYPLMSPLAAPRVVWIGAIRRLTCVFGGPRGTRTHNLRKRLEPALNSPEFRSLSADGYRNPVVTDAGSPAM